MTPVKVLIVDDSRTMRALLKHALDGDAAIEVVGEAASPVEARDKIKALDPDVVTLDIEMPDMNGLEFLEKIMRLRPTPVIMVSNLTQPGAGATLRALEIGAFDCISKPGGTGGNTLEHLPGLVKEAAKAKRHMAQLHTVAAVARAQRPDAARNPRWPDLVAIGSSTGGVEALIQVLADFPADCPPTLIVQHLPAAFTTSFSARLDKVCRAFVSEAKDGEELKRGHVYVAPGGQHLTLQSRRGLRLQLDQEDPMTGHRPSVDRLFHSIADNFDGRATGIVLTGMGRDGAEGLLRMRDRGAKTLAQDEASSLVYGMPRVAYDIGAATKQVALRDVARETFG